jgi:Uma2 family endonuclease
MATVSTPPVESAQQPTEQRFLMRGIDWATYRKISEALSGRHYHLGYDRGNLELMTISSLHARLSRLLGQLIVVLAEETGLPRCSCGDMTCERQELERAVEPDECFYLKNEPLIRGKEEIDLAKDPPPDLAVEIDISRSSLNRLGIYAALGVPEVWRFNGETLSIYHRLSPEQYAVAERSLHFPFVPATEMTRFLGLRGQMDESALVQSFRMWVREQRAGGG